MYWQYNGPHPRELDVFLASDDPRTSWSFQLVARLVFFTWSTESRTGWRSKFDACVLPILSCKRVVMVPTGRIIRWKLEAKSYSWPQTFTVVSVILLLFLAASGATAFFIAVCSHSFSTDFIYSGFRVQFWSSCTRAYLLSPFGVPYGLNCASSFSFCGVEVVLFARSGVSLPESANRVCFCYCQFYQFPLATIGDFSVGYFPLWC